MAAQDMRQHHVDALADQLPGRPWKRLSAGQGVKGERLYDWALMLWAECEGWEHALLVRRSLEAEPEYAFHFTYAGQKQSRLKTLVAVAGQRWAIESAFQMAKPAPPRTGLCPWGGKVSANWIIFEVRHWQGWYRHITLHPSDEDLSPGTPVCPCWLWPFWRCWRAREKKTFRQEGSTQRTGNPTFARFRAAQRLARLEHLLHRSDWRRYHPFLARIFHFRKQQLLLFAISYNCRTNAMNWILSVYEPAREYSANLGTLRRNISCRWPKRCGLMGACEFGSSLRLSQGLTTEVEQGFGPSQSLVLRRWDTGGFPDGFSSTASTSTRPNFVPAELSSTAFEGAGSSAVCVPGLPMRST